MKTMWKGMAVAAALSVGMAGAIQAQAPQPKPQLQPKPSLTLNWLQSVTISPTAIAPGATATGTVTLLRPAVAEMIISFTLVDGQAEEGVYLLNGMVVPSRLVISPGMSSRNFSVYTSAKSAPRNHSIIARYGSESIQVNFSIRR